jgi:tRNA(Arg) A34 adenosine deaminase TadA
MTDVDAMRHAIRKARQSIEAGQSPFGAVVVRNGEIIAEAHNSVWRDCDPTAHAEMNGIRIASAAVKGIFLTGCTMYSTCEPCPMCMSAIHWSRIDRVVFGATIADASDAGFHELCVAADTLVQMGQSSVIVEGGVLQKECAALFEEWRAKGLCSPY